MRTCTYIHTCTHYIHINFKSIKKYPAYILAARYSEKAFVQGSVCKHLYKYTVIHNHTMQNIYIHLQMTTHTYTHMLADSTHSVATK